LEIETNSMYREYKENANISILQNPISLTSTEISPIYYPLISKELPKYYV